MRSIKWIFEKIKRENPNWSDYTCFSRAVSGKVFSKKMISQHFNKLVDSGDGRKSSSMLRNAGR